MNSINKASKSRIMNRTFTIIFLSFSVVSAVPAKSEQESIFHPGSEPLGRCVLDLFNQYQEEYLEKLRYFIENPVGPNPRIAYPHNSMQFRFLIMEIISNCPQERYLSALETARNLLGRDNVHTTELPYFGEMVEESVVSVMNRHFGY